MNYTDYSDFFNIKNFVSCISHRDYDCKEIYQIENFVSALNLDKNNLVIPNQIHSNNILTISFPGIYNDVDGLISKNKKILLSIRVADCIPLFVYCCKTEYFGLIHSGWRGTKNKIVSHTIDKMKLLGSDPRGIKVVIGPSINTCCFEVDLDVSTIFAKRYSKKIKKSKYMLDLKKIVYDELLNSKILSNNILVDDDCTSCNPKKYFSYRRDGDSAGRMLAIAGWNLF